MRKILISAAAAVSALAFAAPAAAQYYPAPAPQGYAYGYNNYGHVRSLQARIDQLQHEIKRLDKRNILSNREADSLRAQSRQLEQQLRYSARNGLSPYEANAFERRLAGLERRIAYQANDGNRYAGRGYNNQWVDRDRDGRNDRWEDDHGYRHD